MTAWLMLLFSDSLVANCPVSDDFHMLHTSKYNGEGLI